MRICDLCGKDIGESGYRTTVCNTLADFCGECYKRYQDKEDELSKKYAKEMNKWLKENKKNGRI